MKRSLVYCVMGIMCLPYGVAFAGTTSITEAGAKNIGSSLAYIAICEKEGFVPVSTLSNLMSVLRNGFTEEAWLRTKNQYQQSLHDKKQYSIAKDQWIPFRINAENCHDIEKAIPMLKAAVIQDQPNR